MGCRKQDRHIPQALDDEAKKAGLDRHLHQGGLEAHFAFE
jgi:hypothetical protein